MVIKERSDSHHPSVIVRHIIIADNSPEDGILSIFLLSQSTAKYTAPDTNVSGAL